MSECFDLHVHSSVSDGSLAPGEVVRRAARKRVAGLALTDHDTVAGLEEARAEGEKVGVQVLAGMEVSVCEANGERQMHILGLGIDTECPRLLSELERMGRARVDRAVRMLEILRELGVELPPDFVRTQSARGTVGRPHVAQALVDLGVCRRQQEAFDRFLGRHAPAYVPHAGPTAAEAIAMIHRAGGIAVLAHPPLSVGVDAPGGLDGFVASVAQAGLDGLEVQHPGHSRKQRRRLARLARTHGLVATGGSDYHGKNRPDVELGRGRGNVSVGEEIFQAVLERIHERRAHGPGEPGAPGSTPILANRAQDSASLTGSEGTGNLRRLL